MALNLFLYVAGSPDSVALAKSLINMSLDLHKVRAKILSYFNSVATLF